MKSDRCPFLESTVFSLKLLERLFHDIYAFVDHRLNCVIVLICDWNLCIDTLSFLLVSINCYSSFHSSELCESIHYCLLRFHIDLWFRKIARWWTTLQTEVSLKSALSFFIWIITFLTFLAIFAWFTTIVVRVDLFIIFRIYDAAL